MLLAYETETETEQYFSQLNDFRKFMLEFKDKPVRWENFDPWDIFEMLAVKTWDGTEKHPELKEF